ncbi:MAG: YigZ family protein [candidate division Zixibacteria bacterium]
MNDSYFTIAQAARAEIKVKGSRFIGEAALVTDAAGAKKYLESVRKREYEATHHCYAHRLGIAGDIEFKYSDDGEPNGSAGKPIYDCIAGRELTSIIVVVTRYYGGTKLGTGGLARAYSEAALRSLEKAGKKTNYITDSIQLTIEFSFYDQILKVIEKLNAQQTESDFSEKVSLTVLIRKSLTEQFVRELTDITRGTAQIEKQENA